MSGSEKSPPASTRIGSLQAPHGVQGGVKLFVLGDPAQLRGLGRVYVESKGWLNVRRIEGNPPGLVLHLAGVLSREAADTLRGLNVYAADAELPPLEQGSYYYHDLRGLPVRNEAGEVLGEVSDVLDMGHQDLLEVQSELGGGFLPLQAPYVVVKLAGRKPVAIELTADAPAGLLGPDDEPSDEPTEPEED